MLREWELDVLKTLDGYDGYLGIIGNGGFTNGVQVIVDGDCMNT